MNNFDKYKKNLKILFIKSDSMCTKISLKVLEKNFDNITFAKDGLTGFRLFMKHRRNENTKFDLVISDIELDYINGIDMLERIRKYEDTPFVFLTKNNNYNVVLKAIKLQIVSYLIRPLTIQNIKEIINKKFEKINSNIKRIKEA